MCCVCFWLFYFWLVFLFSWFCACELILENDFFCDVNCDYIWNQTVQPKHTFKNWDETYFTWESLCNMSAQKSWLILNYVNYYFIYAPAFMSTGLLSVRNGCPVSDCFPSWGARRFMLPTSFFSTLGPCRRPPLHHRHLPISTDLRYTSTLADFCIINFLWYTFGH